MKVMTIVGTRPELIRLSRVIYRLDTTEGIDHILVHTGQNYDYELNQIFFEDLDLRQPDHMLGVDTSSLGAVLGGTLIAAERVMLEEAPDAVIILGDTNSSIAAIIARRLRIPVYHLEAGNRSYDSNVPEETNRRLVDHVVDFNLPYTEHARQNLLAEGIHPRTIAKTGSPMREVLNHHKKSIADSTICRDLGLITKQYFVASAHREENVDSPGRLRQLILSLTALHDTYGMPVYVSTHPRTRNRLEQAGITAIPGITFGAPLGFHDYNNLQLNSACTLSDSGTIAEESLILDFPALTLRDSIERPEALDTGGIIMTGLDREDILRTTAILMNARRKGGPSRIPGDYKITNFSERVVNFVLSTVRRRDFWAGLRPRDLHAGG